MRVIGAEGQGDGVRFTKSPNSIKKPLPQGRGIFFFGLVRIKTGKIIGDSASQIGRSAVILVVGDKPISLAGVPVAHNSTGQTTNWQKLKMKTDEIRQKYFDFFVSKGHQHCQSDVLVPKDDPSVLFTPAGMNQFKDHFLGKVALTFTRATTCQKCFRTGDIDNVGRTAFHHTFFEMLGNFSFGDYFKKEAISWAWEFLTDPKWLGIDSERLFVTVYKDDDEAAEIWEKEIGLPKEKIKREDEDENFWPASAPSQGPDGVCGPCSEIYYVLDDGSDVEIWNLVFTQFNRKGNPPENLFPLPSKNIDTGMGLERIASVLQKEETNYHIDSLKPIVLRAAELLGKQYEYQSEDGRRCRRITDHIRACTFAIHENILPGEKGAAYQIRLLLRRAILDSYQMGSRQPVLSGLVEKVIEMMGSAYPELKETQSFVEEEIKKEEKQYLNLLEKSVPVVEKELNRLLENGVSSTNPILSGELAYRWKSTNGIPKDLTISLAEKNNVDFDYEGYDKAEEAHIDVSGGDQVVLFQTGPIEELKEELRSSEFLGYETCEAQTTIKGIVWQNKRYETFDECDLSELSEKPSPDNCVQIVMDRSPFYAESGGQVGDTGWLEDGTMRFEVLDTIKASDLIVHFGLLREGEIRQDQQVTASVDFGRRQGICRAHSATHILHHALQQHIGSDANQRGSKVQDDELRFDFKCDTAVSQELLERIENQVRKTIEDDHPVTVDNLPIEKAREAGAMMLFGEKYPEVVRMVSIGSFSKELCGGTHLESTSDMAAFNLISDDQISAGTRRIIAFTGEKAVKISEDLQSQLSEISTLLGVPAQQTTAAAESLSAHIKSLKKMITNGKVDKGFEIQWSAPKELQTVGSEEDNYQRRVLKETSRILNCPIDGCLDRLKSMVDEIQDLKTKLESIEKADSWDADSLLESKSVIEGVDVVIAQTDGANPNRMRTWIDQIRQKDGSAAVFLVSKVAEGKVVLVAGLTRDLVEKGISAGNWVKEVAPTVGGGGGGKPDLAQAGGKNPEKIGEALSKAKTVISAQLSA